MIEALKDAAAALEEALDGHENQFAQQDARIKCVKEVIKRNEEAQKKADTEIADTKDRSQSRASF